MVAFNVSFGDLYAGMKLKAEDMYPALELFGEILHEAGEFVSKGVEPHASMGDFIRTEVQWSCALLREDKRQCSQMFFLCWCFPSRSVRFKMIQSNIPPALLTTPVVH